MRRTIAIALMLPASGGAHAVESVMGTSLQAMGALGIVIGLLVAALLFLKRISPGRFAASGLLKPVASLAVGPRERVVVIEVGDTWIVAGVTAHAVNALATLPKGTLPADAMAAATTGSFAETLRKALPGKRT